MNLKSKLLVFITLSLLCASFFVLLPSYAYSSDSFNTKSGNEYIWEVKLINPGEYVNPYLQQIGDRLKLVVTIANTTEIGVITYYSIYGNLYYNTKANRTWVQTDPPGPVLLAIYNGTYMDAFTDLPYLISRNVTINDDWFFDEFLSYGSKSAITLAPFRVYSSHTTTHNFGDPYEEYDYKSGVLFSFGFALWNGSAWDIHTLIVSSSAGGIPGFHILPTLLILTGFLAVHVLLSHKKQKIIA
jgi:hypothetical protein